MTDERKYQIYQAAASIAAGYVARDETIQWIEVIEQAEGLLNVLEVKIAESEKGSFA